MDDSAVRTAAKTDLEAIRRIYNEGIEDGIATLETARRTAKQMEEWWDEHGDRYAVLVASTSEGIAGWASLNRFSHRCAHAAIADLSVYVTRARCGTGIGTALLSGLNVVAQRSGFHKIVLHALDSNEAGKRLYLKSGLSRSRNFSRTRSAPRKIRRRRCYGETVAPPAMTNARIRMTKWLHAIRVCDLLMPPIVRAERLPRRNPSHITALRVAVATTRQLSRRPPDRTLTHRRDA